MPPEEAPAAPLVTPAPLTPERTATVRRRPVRAVVKAPEPASAPKPEPEPAPAPVAAPAPEPAKDDCNPPYYFEGEKKIFKPSCI